MKAIRFIGRMIDPITGIDNVGEIFTSITDAEFTLHKRMTDHGSVLRQLRRPDGTLQELPTQLVAPEAIYELWRIEPIRYEDVHAGTFIDKPWEQGHAADVFIWKGRRHAMRHGNAAQFSATLPIVEKWSDL